MTYSKKKLLAIMAVVFAFFLTTYLLLSYAGSLNPSEVNYPKSGLSNSIFESQNSTYLPQELLPNTVDFENIPYTFDVPSVDAAKVDLGKVYKLSDKIYIYASEYSKKSVLNGVIAHEVGTVLLQELDENQSILRVLKSEEGYINGKEAQYVVERLTVTDGVAQRVDSYILGYELTIPDTTENVFLGVISLGEADSTVLETMQNVMNSFLYTFQYSDDLDKKQTAAAMKALEEEEEKRRKEAVQANLQAEEEAEQKELAEKENEKTKNLAVILTQDYTDLQLKIYWTNKGVTPTFTLYTPDQSMSYKPTSVTNGTAYFSVGSAKQGTWVLEVYGENYGECSMEQAEGGVASFESDEDVSTDIQTSGTDVNITTDSEDEDVLKPDSITYTDTDTSSITNGGTTTIQGDSVAGGNVE